MEIRFNVEKEKRKALVQAIGEIVGYAPIYKKAPGFEYVVHNYIIDRYGTLIYDERTNEADVRHLLAELAVRGFEHDGVGDIEGGGVTGVTDTEADAETDTMVVVVSEAVVDTPPTDVSAGHEDAEADADDANEAAPPTETTETSTFSRTQSFVGEDGLHLTIEVPLVGFTATALDNLDKLVEGKATLIMKSVGAEALPIERTGNTLRFPWFPVISSYLEVDAYSRLIYALCEMAKKQKRVTMKERAVSGEDSEKFAFRTFLLRLGFIGAEYASARKVLLSKLSGSGSFKNGDHKDRFAHKGSETAHNGGESKAVVTACNDDYPANNGLTGCNDAEMVSEVTVHG